MMASAPSCGPSSGSPQRIGTSRKNRREVSATLRALV